mmetsp:Transcript_6895/g.14210  ORF Transcript_6895/g.14210 Transcript_6895/m.14210 type:complete len:1258 (-) Transcript_6895:1935-5708(-)
MCMDMSFQHPGSRIALFGESGRRWTLLVEKVIEGGVVLVRDETLGAGTSPSPLVAKIYTGVSDEELEMLREETLRWRSCGVPCMDLAREGLAAWRHILRLDEVFILDTSPEAKCFIFLMEHATPLTREKVQSEDKVLRAIAHISSGLDAILDANLKGHGAVRLKNCFLLDGRVKLGGFGLSRARLVQSREICERNDITALGSLMYELMFGKLLPEGLRGQNLLADVEALRTQNRYSKKLAELLVYCLESKASILELRYQIAAQRGLVPPFALHRKKSLDSSAASNHGHGQFQRSSSMSHSEDNPSHALSRRESRRHDEPPADEKERDAKHNELTGKPTSDKLRGRHEESPHTTENMKRVEAAKPGSTSSAHPVDQSVDDRNLSLKSHTGKQGVSSEENTNPEEAPHKPETARTLSVSESQAVAEDKVSTDKQVRASTSPAPNPQTTLLPEKRAPQDGTTMEITQKSSLEKPKGRTDEVGDGMKRPSSQVAQQVVSGMEESASANEATKSSAQLQAHNPSEPRSGGDRVSTESTDQTRAVQPEIKKISSKDIGESNSTSDHKKGGTRSLDVMITKFSESELDPASASLLASIVVEIKERKSAASEVYKLLHKKPISKEPITAFKILSLLYITLCEAGDEFCEVTRKQHEFLEWAEACWTKERVSKKLMKSAHSHAQYFARGEVSLLAGLIALKASLHEDNPCGFSPSWSRSSSPRRTDASECRALVLSVLPLLERVETLVSVLVFSTDAATNMKMQILPAIVRDVRGCYTSILDLVQKLDPDERRRLQSDISYCHKATRQIMESVRTSKEAADVVDSSLLLDLVSEPPVLIETEVIVDGSRRLEVGDSHRQEKRDDKNDHVAVDRRVDAHDERSDDNLRSSIRSRGDRAYAAVEKINRFTPRRSGDSFFTRKKSVDPSDDATEPTRFSKTSGGQGEGDGAREPQSKPETPKRRKPKAAEGRDTLVGTRPAEDAAFFIPEAIGGNGQVDLMDPMFEIAPHDILIQEEIGRGGFGTVYKGRYHGKRVAVKKIHPQTVKSRKAIEEFQREIGVLCRLRHPNILLFMGACTKPPNLMIITEFMARGTLFDLLHRSNTRLTLKMVVGFALDVCRGVLYLHRCRLLHRDLKSSNMMLDDELVVKVGDFGLTRPVSGPTAPMTGQTGTFQYMAPEVLSSRPYSEKADVFSFGVLLWELAARRLPYFGLEPMQVGLAVVNQGLRPSIPPECSPALVKIIKLCWDQDPHRRPNLDQAMKLLENVPFD